MKRQPKMNYQNYSDNTKENQNSSQRKAYHFDDIGNTVTEEIKPNVTQRFTTEQRDSIYEASQRHINGRRDDSRLYQKMEKGLEDSFEIETEGSDYFEEDNDSIFDRNGRTREDGSVSRAKKTKNSANAKPKKKKKAGKVIGIIAGVIVIIALVLAIFPGARNWALKALLKTPLASWAANMIMGDSYDEYVYDSDFDKSTVRVNAGVSEEKGWYSFVLLGIDARSDELSSGSARTDSITICSVSKSGDIRMASISRDTFLQMHGREGSVTYNKANAAYAYGEAAETLSMINENFDLAIDDYIVLNFYGLTNIVDLLGGLELEITDDEVYYINYYLENLNDIDDTTYDEVTESGKVTLTGAQVTAYCRIRYCNFTSPLTGETYTSDWGRSERQRYVLTELLSQYKSLGFGTLLTKTKEICEANSGDVQFITSSLELKDVVSLLSMCLDLNISESQTFPAIDFRYTKNLSIGSSIICDTQEENAVLLHEFLYDTKDYEVSLALEEIAASVRAAAGVW